MTTSKTFDLKLFSREFSKNIHPGKLQFTLSPERLSWLFLLWEVNPSPDCKLIKLLTFLTLFLLLSTVLLQPDLGRTTDKITLFTRAHYSDLRFYFVFYFFLKLEINTLYIFTGNS